MAKLGELIKPAPAYKRGTGNSLTPAQLRCARLTGIGVPQKNIARELRVTKKTVEKHMQAVNEHLGTHCPVDTDRKLILLGYLEIDEWLQPDIVDRATRLNA